MRLMSCLRSPPCLAPLNAGFAITYLSRQLDARHPANWKLLTLLAAANNITLGLLYEHQPAAVCGSTVAKVAAFAQTPQPSLSRLWPKCLSSAPRCSSIAPLPGV